MTFSQTFAALSIVSAAVASAVVWIMGVHDVTQLATHTGVFLILSACVHGVMAWYRRSLIKRMEETNTKAWAIQISGVQVDVITDRAYAALQRQVYGSASLLLAQGRNLLRGAALMGAFIAALVPLLAFWVNTVSLSNSTLAPTALLAMTAKANAGDTHTMLITLTAASFLLALTLLLFMPSVFGLRNLYREDANGKLRRFAKSATDGEVSLVPAAAIDATKPFRKDSLSLVARRPD